MFPKSIKIWWQAARYHFIPPSIFPVCIGAIVSWASENSFSLWYFFLLISAVILNHIALNMTDDYFDYKYSVDQLKPNEKNPYTGGSGTLTEGLIRPRSMLKAFVLLYIITIIIGLFLTYERGVLILLFWFIGIFSSIFYTAPPIKFSHHGWGEFGLLVNFGPVLGLLSFFVQSQMITLEAFVATLPCGIMLFSMIIINEIPDLNDDKRAGKLTIIARYGIHSGIKIYVFSWICTYLWVVLGVLLSIVTPYFLISLIFLPVVIQSIISLQKNYDNPQKLPIANLSMIRAHSLICISFIGSYILSGLELNRDTGQVLGFILLFIIVYIPAAIPIFKRMKKG